MRLLLIVAVALVAPVEAVAGSGDGCFGEDAWRAEIVRRGLSPDRVVYPFAVSPEMTAWAEAIMEGPGGLDPLQRLTRLQLAMFEGQTFDFAYDDERTLTAEQAFAERRGNCMSFTALFIALSRDIGIPTFLMSVQRDPEIERDEGLVVINRHVVAGYRSGSGVAKFDFYLRSTAPFIRFQVIDDVRASAMFHANLGGAALREGDLVGARSHLELATALSPDWAGGWVNLGVTLARLEDISGAFAAYDRALEVDPGNSSALNNMSYLYRLLGREAEARVALRAAAQGTDNPFTLIAMADVEMLQGNTGEARRFLRRAKRWYPNQPEVYEGLARLARRMGDDDRAEKRMRTADKLRTTPDR